MAEEAACRQQAHQFVQHHVRRHAERLYRRHCRQRRARRHRLQRSRRRGRHSHTCSRLPSGCHSHPHDGLGLSGSLPQPIYNLESTQFARQTRSTMAPTARDEEKTQLRALSGRPLCLDIVASRRRMDHSSPGPPRPLTPISTALLYSFVESFSEFSISFASRSCSRSLYPTGNSNVRSSAVKTRMFRVESSIAEQISQCSRCRSISSRSLASTLLSMYSEMCSQTCLQSSFIAPSRKNSSAREPSFSGKEPGAFAAGFAHGVASLSPHQS